MKDTKKYYDYIDKLINDTPDFMLINDDESYVLLDRLVVDLSENAMTWLFKVYLDQNYNILKEEGITAIMVTHDIGEAASISSKVIVMSKRPSKIKNVYLMDYQDVLKPLERRKSPLFNLYYDKLWRDIDEGK